MKIEKILITPELATELLKKNNSNRNVNKKAVSQYASDITNGRWMEDTGETIKIAKDDTILDGQHRLMAIIKANVPCYMHIAKGLNNSVFTVIDTGKKRSSCDILHIQGVKNSTCLSGILNKYLYLKSGSKGRRFNGVLTNKITFDEYLKNPKVWDAICENACRWYVKFNKITAASILGGWYSFFYEIDKEDAFNFFEQLATGDGIKNPTINVLRNALIKDKLSTDRMVEEKRSALIVKTWNCFRKGTTLQFLTYSPNDEKIKAE